MSDMRNRPAADMGGPHQFGADLGQATTSPISEPPPTTVWAGWAFFAGVVMMLVGAFQIIKALTALFNQDYLLVKSNGLAVHIDIAVWGWAHLVIGLVVLAASFGVIAGRMWGRVVGIVMIAVSAIVNLLDIAAYPLWSIIIIAIDVLIIYALAVHGGELKSV
jgi:hypothetical protein